MAKQTKVITRRKKFQEIEVPLARTKVELIGNSLEDVDGKTMKLDLTRMLKGKSIEVVVKVNVEKDKASASPIKMKLMPYFIRRMIRKRISYVEDSFETPSQESMILIKPFLITRKRVSRVVRKTLRNKARNWLEDYISQKNDNEIFNEVLTNKIQKPLSLVLKKTYPLSLCEIRILEIKRPLKPEEVPKKIKKKIEEVQGKEVIDQLKEIEEERIEKAKEEIKKTQLKASEKEKEVEKEEKEEVKELKKVSKSKKSEKSESKVVKDTKTKEKKTKVKKEKKEAKK